MLKPYKFVVQAVCQQVEDGQVVGEAQTAPVEVFGVAGLQQWANDFPAHLAEAAITPA